MTHPQPPNPLHRHCARLEHGGRAAPSTPDATMTLASALAALPSCAGIDFEPEPLVIKLQSPFDEEGGQA